MKSARERMDMNAAYREVGSYRAAAEICGTTDKTVKRAVAKAQAAEAGLDGADGRRPQLRRRGRPSSLSGWSGPTAGSRPSGSCPSPGRRLRRARPATCAGWWPRPRRSGGSSTTGAGAPGCGHRATCWCSTGGRSARCSSSAPCWPGVAGALRVSSPTTWGPRPPWPPWPSASRRSAGCRRPLLTDRMGCLKGSDRRRARRSRPRHYVRFATHYGFRPDFCEGADPESKGLVEHLVGYVKSDLMIPEELSVADLVDAERQGPGVVRRGERPGALRDRRGPARAARHRTADALSSALAAGPDRQAGDAQGRPAQLRPLRLGPLLGAERPTSAVRSSSGGRRRGHGRALRGDRRRARPRRPW